VSVGFDVVEPFSCVHPEKVFVPKFMLLVQRLLPSDPTTAIRRVFVKIVADGESGVVPEGRAVQLVHVCEVMLSKR